MADGFSIDFSELDTLAADLGDVAAGAGRRVGQAVEITARRVKDDWADKLKGEPHLPHASRSITYDTDVNTLGPNSVISAEIGAERGRLQAPIVTVVEFGAPGNNTAPKGYGAGALQENEADFIRGLEIATDPQL